MNQFKASISVSLSSNPCPVLFWLCSITLPLPMRRYSNLMMVEISQSYTNLNFSAIFLRISEECPFLVLKTS